MQIPKKHILLAIIYFTYLVCSRCSTVWSLNTILMNGPWVTSPRLHGHFSLAEVMTQGARLGINECRHQFKWERWNCSSDGTSMLTSSNYPYGGYNWKWGGCSDNIQKAIFISRQYLDSMETGNDARAAMNLHNNEAGRKAVKKKMQLICKCHGVSGSCAAQTCWKKLSDLGDVGHFIKRKYRRATIVYYHQGRLLQVGNKAWGDKPIPFVSKLDLIYLNESPDYCKSNASAKTAGTLGRVCSRGNKNSKKLEDKIEARSCNNLCRKCGYQVREMTVVVTGSCDCKFLWCCSVECQNCTRTSKQLECVP